MTRPCRAFPPIANRPQGRVPIGPGTLRAQPESRYDGEKNDRRRAQRPSIGGSMASVIVESVPPRARAARSPFYVGIALLVVVTVLAGFAPSFYAIAVDGRPRPWIMHVHAAVYLGWLALLVCQAVLAARGKIATHRRVGTLGIYYAAAVWILGVTVSFVAP